MKKTYTGFRLGLLLALFTFNTLASCVNTGRELGMRGEIGLASTDKSIKELEKNYYKIMHENGICRMEKIACRCCKPKNNCKKPLLFTTLGLVVLGGVSGLGITLTTLYNNNKLSEPIPIAENTVTNTTMSYISSENTTTSLQPNNTNRHINLPNVSGIYLENLYNSYNIDNLGVILDDMREHNFETSRMQYWLDLGLDINAQDEDGATLLMAGVQLDLYDLVKFIVTLPNKNNPNEYAVDVNLRDKKGNTAIVYANPLSPKSNIISELLLERGADPCIKNTDGRGLDSKPNIELSMSLRLLEAVENCGNMLAKTIG